MESIEEGKEYLTLKEVAFMVGSSYGTVKRNIDNGKLAAYRIGRKYFVKKDDAEKYCDNISQLKSVDGYTIQELMMKLPLSYAFFVDLIKTKKLSAIKVGREYIVPVETFDCFMQKNKLES